MTHNTKTLILVLGIIALLYWAPRPKATKESSDQSVPKELPKPPLKPEEASKSIPLKPTQAKEESQTNPNPIKPIPNGKLDLSCMNPNFNFEEYILEVAKELERQKLPYTSRPGSGPDNFLDCSGIFTRVVRKVQEKMDPCKTFIFPGAGQRSSRSFAEWYAKNGNIIMIQGNPKDYGKDIKPGAVLFYGRRNKQYNKVNINTLATEVNHVGLVTAVEKDAISGKVTNYFLFHGHGRPIRFDEQGKQIPGTGTPADITNYHAWKDNHLAYGNYDEQLLAIAPSILTKK